MSRRDPDQAAVHQTALSLMTYAKNHLSFEEDTGPVKIRDPKGEAIFNAQFVPKFEAALSSWQKGGKDPWQFLTRDNVDKIMEGMRSPAEMARDRLAATADVLKLAAHDAAHRTRRNNRARNQARRPAAQRIKLNHART